MKKISIFIIASGIVFGLAARPVSAQEKTDKDDAKVQGKAVSGLNFLKDEKESSKFFEYRDVPRGVFLRSFDLNVEKGNSFFILNGKNVRQADSRYDISAGSYGTFRADFTWDEIPHRFSFSGKTLYTESKPGVYVLPDGLQTLIQNAVGDGSANATANMPAGRGLLQNFLTGAHGVDLGLERHKGTLNLVYTPAVAWSFNLDARRETKEGTRPLGAAFGRSNTIEVPEPIHYTTTDLQASAEYGGKWGTVQAGYSASIFDNAVQALSWENPYRITDQTYGTSTHVAGNGPREARMSLDPSNTANKFYLNTAVKLLPTTKLVGSVSYGVFSQDEKLLPYTSNTALIDPVVGFPGALSSPRATTEAKANIASMDFTLTSRILKNIHLTAGYRYYDFANKTEALEMPDGLSVADGDWSKTAHSIEPYSYTRSRMFGDLTFNVLKGTSLKAGYTISSIERKGGYEGELAETAGEGNKNKTDEKTFKISVDSNPLDWLLLRVSYLSAARTWSLDGKVEILSSVQNYMRFFEASRNRKGLNFLVGLDLIKNVDVQFSYMSGEDTYPQSAYGLKSSDFTMAGVDLSYAIGPDTAFYGFYSGEDFKGAQRARRRTTSDDWWANTKDSVQSFGAGFQTALKKNVLHLDISSIYSKAKGSADIGAGPTGSFDKINVLAYTQPIDMTVMLNLRAKLIWKAAKNFSVALGYWFEQYKFDDIVLTDGRVDLIVPVSITGGASANSTIFLGAVQPGYLYHVGFLEFIWGW